MLSSILFRDPVAPPAPVALHGRALRNLRQRKRRRAARIAAGRLPGPSKVLILEMPQAAAEAYLSGLGERGMRRFFKDKLHIYRRLSQQLPHTRKGIRAGTILEFLSGQSDYFCRKVRLNKKLKKNC